jgi:hypothetical protein
MKLAVVLSILCALVLTACNGAVVGNLLVLGVTVGIFMATLSLGRSADSTRSTDSTQSRG